MRLTALLFLTLPALASADTARTRLEQFAEGLKSLTGEFAQRTLDANGALQEESSGNLALAAPRQFRWRYVEPFPQLIVADGNNVWIYDEDLEQVTVRNQSTEETRSPLTVLVDLSQLDRDYTVHELAERDDLLWLELRSREQEPGFKRIEIGFDGQAPVQMRLEDLLGNHTEWRFTRWKRNAALPNDTFRFSPPAGADVIGEPISGAETAPLVD